MPLYNLVKDVWRMPLALPHRVGDNAFTVSTATPAYAALVKATFPVRIRVIKLGSYGQNSPGEIYTVYGATGFDANKRIVVSGPLDGTLDQPFATGDVIDCRVEPGAIADLNASSGGSLPTQPATTLTGNPTGSSATPSAITLGTNLSFSGSTLNAAGGGGLTPIAAATILANPTGSSANPVQTNLTAGVGIVGGGVGLTGVITETSQSASFTAAWGGASYVVTGSAIVTATLTTAVGNAGGSCSIRAARSYTGTLTVVGASGQSVGGAASRVLLPGERAVLQSNGTDTDRIGGVIIACFCQMTLSAAQAIPGDGAQHFLLYDTIVAGSTSRMGDVASHGIRLLRPGNYRVTYSTAIGTVNSSTSILWTQAGTSGSGINGSGFRTQNTGAFSSPFGFGSTMVQSILGGAIGDLITVQVYQSNSGNVPQNYDAGDNWLMVEEIPSW